MKDFEALKALWKVQKAPTESSEEMLRQIRQDSRYFAQKILVQTLSVTLGLMVLLAIGLFFHFHTWTTYIALFVLSACLLYYILIQIREYKILQRPVAMSLTPNQFIQYLKTYNQRNKIQNRRNYRLYLLGIICSFMLLLVELYFVLPLWIIALFFAGTVLWLYVAWKYILKEYILRRQTYFEQLIQKLSKLQQQFDA